MGNSEKAALAVYNTSEKNASTIAASLNKKLDFSYYLDKAGLTDEHVSKTIYNASLANKVISARITSKEADIHTDDFIEVPDHMVRLKASELALKYKHTPKDAKESTGNTYIQYIHEQKNKYGI